MSIQDISCAEAKKLIQQGAQLIDVRSTLEYQQGCLPGAVNLPLEYFQAALDQLDRENPIILYCRSGMRSGQAKRFLQSLGFDAVHNLGSFQNFFQCAEPQTC